MPTNGFNTKLGRVFFKETLTTAGYGTIIVPDADPARLENIYIQIKVNGATATGTIQFTSDDPVLVAANDASVTWVNWTNGTVVDTETSYNIVGRAMTGIRAQMTGVGTVIWGASY